jgi:hypothetical protein
MKVYTTSLAMATDSFPKPLCRDPLPLLAAVIGVLSESEASPALPDESKTQVTEAICFLAERLATLQALVDPSTPAVYTATAKVTPKGTRRAPARLMLNDIARGLARRVPLTKLVQLDGDVRPYLAALMIAALHKAGETLVIPDKMAIKRMTE